MDSMNQSFQNLVEQMVVEEYTDCVKQIVDVPAKYEFTEVVGT
jgi:hypothetical protein